MQRIRESDRGSCAVAPLAALAWVLLGIGACGPAPEEQTAQRDQAAPPAAVPAPQAMPPAGAEQVTVRISEDTVEVSPTTVASGAVTFEVTNATSVPYDVDIDGPGPDGEAERLQPGETRTVQMNLQAGTYEVEVESEEGPSREWETRIDVQG